MCTFEPARGAGGGWPHALVVLAFVGVMGVWTGHVTANDPYARPSSNAATAATAAQAARPADAAEAARCKVPDFAKALGHEAKWKLHNNCP